jgi:hypothetical protein
MVEDKNEKHPTEDALNKCAKHDCWTEYTKICDDYTMY